MLETGHLLNTEGNTGTYFEEERERVRRGFLDPIIQPPPNLLEILWDVISSLSQNTKDAPNQRTESRDISHLTVFELNKVLFHKFNQKIEFELSA